MPRRLRWRGSLAAVIDPTSNAYRERDPPEEQQTPCRTLLPEPNRPDRPPDDSHKRDQARKEREDLCASYPTTPEATSRASMPKPMSASQATVASARSGSWGASGKRSRAAAVFPGA